MDSSSSSRGSCRRVYELAHVTVYKATKNLIGKRDVSWWGCRGYEWAAAHPEEAADMLLTAGNADNPSLKQPLELGPLRASLQATLPVRHMGLLLGFGIQRGPLCASLQATVPVRHMGLRV